MSKKPNCPKCASANLAVERRPDGDAKCLDCQWQGKYALCFEEKIPLAPLAVGFTIECCAECEWPKTHVGGRGWMECRNQDCIAFGEAKASAAYKEFTLLSTFKKVETQCSIWKERANSARVQQMNELGGALTEAELEVDILRVVARQLDRWRTAWASQDTSDAEPARKAMFKALDGWIKYTKGEWHEHRDSVPKG